MRNSAIWCVLLAVAVAGCGRLSGPNSPQPPEPLAAADPPQPPPLTFSEKEIAFDLGNGVKLEMVLIPAGEFMMGDERQPRGSQDPGRPSVVDDEAAIRGEKPVHRVRITKPFYLGKYEVTQEQWRTVMGNDPSHFDNPRYPVEQVSWYDCYEFLEKLNGGYARANGRFALPTEAQWEYACRAGSTTAYCFGDREASLGEYAWYCGNSGGWIHRVGMKRPNAWGLYDMHGNVVEWCADWHDAGYYAKSPLDDPTGPAIGWHRVVRGGSWTCNATECASAIRSWATEARYSLGLRVALIPRERPPLDSSTAQVREPTGRQRSAQPPKATPKWVAKARRFTLGFPDQAARSLAFSPDGRTLAIVVRGKPSLTLWDVKTGKQLPTGRQPDDEVFSVQWHPAGQSLWVSYKRANRIELLEVPDFRVKTSLVGDRSDSRGRLVVCRDGRRLIAGLVVWDVVTGKPERDLMYCRSYPALSADGTTLATTTRDSVFPITAIVLWDTGTWKERLNIEMPAGEEVVSLAFSPNGRYLASGQDHIFRGGYGTLGSTTRTRQPPGQYLRIRIWDPRTGKELTGSEPAGKVDDTEFAPMWHWGTHWVDIAYSHDSKVLASWTVEKDLTLWDAAEQSRLLDFKPYPKGFERLVFSPTEDLMAMICRDGLVHVWDVNRLLKRPPKK